MYVFVRVDYTLTDTERTTFAITMKEAIRSLAIILRLMVYAKRTQTRQAAKREREGPAQCQI